MKRKKKKIINDKKIKLNKLIKDYQEAYNELYDYIENPILLKANEMLRKIKSEVNENTSIEGLIDKSKYIYSEFKKFEHENETNNEIRKNILDIIYPLESLKNQFIAIKKYKYIIEELKKNEINSNKLVF